MGACSTTPSKLHNTSAPDQQNPPTIQDVRQKGVLKNGPNVFEKVANKSEALKSTSDSKVLEQLKVGQEVLQEVILEVLDSVKTNKEPKTGMCFCQISCKRSFARSAVVSL